MKKVVKKVLSLLIALTLALFVVTPVFVNAAAAPVLVNAGFESYNTRTWAPNDWELTGSVYVTQDSYAVRSGTNALSIQSNGTLKQTVAATNGAYQLSLWYSGNITPNSIKVFVNNVDIGLNPPSLVWTPTEFVSDIITVTNNEIKVEIVVTGNSSLYGGIDDLVFKVVEEAPPPPPVPQLVNAGFENYNTSTWAPNDWELTGSVYVTQDSYAVRSGTNALSIQSNGTLKQTVAATNGTYQLSLWYSGNITPNSIKVFVNNIDIGLNPPSLVWTPTEFVSDIITVTNNEVKVEIVVTGNSGLYGGIDDLVFKNAGDTPPPPPVPQFINASFEDYDPVLANEANNHFRLNPVGWTITGGTAYVNTWFGVNNGNVALSVRQSNGVKLEQEIDLPNGDYRLVFFTEGNISASTVRVYINDQLLSLSYSGWSGKNENVYDNITVANGKMKLTIELRGNDVWGGIDDFKLYAMDNLPPPPLATLKLSPESINLRPGTTVMVQPREYLNHTFLDAWTYTSSNTSIAIVDATGLVTIAPDFTGDQYVDIVVEGFYEGVKVSEGVCHVRVSDTFQKHHLTQEISIDPIPALENGTLPDFMYGVDISSYLQLIRSGRKFYDQNGVERNLFEMFSESGVNCIRLRVWNDPKDTNGNWYGGGNNDAAAMIEMAKMADAAGMGVYVDFHYSDFWADPGKQLRPKAWRGFTKAELEDAIYDYTYEVLTDLKNEGITPLVVSVGNEIHWGILREDELGNPLPNPVPGWEEYIRRGIKAVRDVYGNNTDIMLHCAVFDWVDFFNQFIDDDYDMIGLSYYPYWSQPQNTSITRLINAMDQMAARFGKKIVLAETGYAFTTAEYDPYDNQGNFFGNGSVVNGIPATVQGQATFMRQVMEAVANVRNGLGGGVFYWEAAWLPGNDTGWSAEAGQVYEGGSPYDFGSVCENWAFVNFFGEKLPSMDVFKLVRGNATVVAITTNEDSVVNILEIDKGVWQVTIEIVKTLSNGVTLTDTIDVLIPKNGSGTVDLGDYILIYDIKGNGSNIKTLEIIMKL